MMIHFLLKANNEILVTIGFVVAAVVILVLALILLNFGMLWIQAASSGAPVSIRSLVGMWLRKVNPKTIVDALIMSVQSEIKDVNIKDLETHYLARGNVPNVIRALIAANRANIPLSFPKAAAIDLAGRDVLEAVQTSVNPKVIDCPSEDGRTSIAAVAKDGIQLKAKARVTVRANIDRLVGGAKEETIIARVGEGIVSAIGSADTHKKVLENPDLISQYVLGKGLDSGTAFEILSIDIADVDVGDNIGAQLQADQAEADRRVAQAKAEERRAMAIAQEQEMKAKVKENRAKVVLAQAEVPKAIAEAFRQGNIYTVKSEK